VILAGDIGGTKTVLAVCDAEFTIVRTATFPSAEHASLEAILEGFVKPDERGDLTSACFGVAGPVVDGVAKITNLPWTIDARAVSTQLGGIPVTLLNDLQATALGILVLPEPAFAVLQRPAAAVEGGTIAVLAPGTGLGMALLVAVDGQYRALPSEGGHSDFAPGNDDEIALLRYLRGVHGDHVSYERVLSGDGIGDLYDFVREATRAPAPAWPVADRNAAISQAALERSDPAAVRALEMFVEILAAQAGNLALVGLATGGIVLGGGIPPKILAALQHRRFVDRLHAKGRFADFTRGLSVRVALEPRAALFGAAHHAATHKDARS
jgi:glucokinase